MPMLCFPESHGSVNALIKKGDVRAFKIGAVEFGHIAQSLISSGVSQSTT